MTRADKIKETLAAYKASLDESKFAWEPSADPRAAAFYLRRAEQSMQFRYWARYGHELPKVRKFICKKLPCT